MTRQSAGAAYSSVRRSSPLRIAVRGLIVALTLLVVGPAIAIAAFPGADGRIAFTRGGAIWAVNPDGTGVAQITHPPAGVTHSEPAWSPDGQRIAFRRSAGSAGDIYTVRADDTGLRQITKSLDLDYVPAWSPDGQRLAFSRFVDDRLAADLWVVGSDGTNERRIVTSADYRGALYPAWSPAEDAIAFSDLDDVEGTLRLIRADGTNNRAFPGMTEPTVQMGDSDRDPSWAPDGSRVAYSRQRPNWEVAVIQRNGTNRRILTSPTDVTSDPQPSLNPAWSPEGQRIVYVRGGSLYLMNADGTGKHLLVPDASDPDWQAVPPANPLPSVSAITPAGVQVGRTTNLSLSVTGSGFRTSSIVRWNGESRPTTYVSSTRLVAVISPADLATPGVAGASVFTGPPGGGESAALGFTISSAGPAVTPPPQVLVAPLISGEARDGRTLVCSAGLWSNSPTAFSWQWLRNGVVLAGATGPAYVPTTADVGDPLTCRVAASNAGGTSSAVSAPVVPAQAPTSAPPVAAGGISQPPAVAPVARPALRVLISSALRVRRGAPLRVKMVLSASQRQTPVALQRRIGPRWVTVRARFVTGRSVIFVVRLNTVGVQRLRVVCLQDGVRRVSPVTIVRVVRAR